MPNEQIEKKIGNVIRNYIYQKIEDGNPAFHSFVRELVMVFTSQFEKEISRRVQEIVHKKNADI